MSETDNKLKSDISADQWQQLLSLFDELVDQPSVEQTQRIQSLNLSPPVAGMLKKMLNVQHHPNILDQTIDPLVEVLLGSEAVNEHSNPTDILGRTFGAWQAIETLGTGGMGQVFVATRADGQFEKQVALKVIKSGRFSEFSQQRFLAEMRTLAQFEHPNIARLIDGGTSEDGIVYFVMELVSGAPIVDYANVESLSLKQRIKLLLQVIDAVEYAHQSLIIHGDIKPANILVNQAGQVKLVDFGTARPMEDNQAESYLPQFTPSYASPEQAQGKVLTTASDVFGLCAVLYELCTGSSPRNKESITTLADYSDTINSPIKPAFQAFKTKQSKSQNNRQHLNHKTYHQALSQELGAIIDKGLQIAVADRYRNTTELRRDLLLFLAGNAVPNFNNSKLYRWKKTCYKFWWPIVFSGMAMLLIMVSAWVAIQQAQKAQQEADKATWMNQFLLSIFTAADPVKNQIQPITVNELTGLAATKMLQDTDNNALKTAALEVLSKIQHRLGEVESSKRLNNKQIELLDSMPNSQTLLAAAHNEGGLIALTQNDFEQSSRHYKQAMLLAPLTQEANKQSIDAAIGLADSYIRLDKPSEAIPIIAALEQHELAIKQLIDPDVILAELYILKTKAAKSEFNYAQALSYINTAKSHAAEVTANAMLYPKVLSIEADLYFEQGEGLKAEKIDRQLVAYYMDKFGEDHPRTIDSLSNLAVSLLSLGKIKETIDVNLQLIDILQTHGITDHQEAASYLNLGIAYDILGEYEMALKNLKLAEDMWLTLTPRYLYYDALTYASSARSLLALKRTEQAAEYYQLALTTLAQEIDVNHHRYAWFEVKYTALLIEQGQLDEAELLLEKAREKIVAAYGETGKRTVLTDLQSAQINALRGDTATAKYQAKHALQVLDVPHVRDRYPAEVALAKKLSGK